MNKKCNWT